MQIKYIDVLFIFFLLQYLIYLGYCPSINQFANCIKKLINGKFYYLSGQIVCNQCTDSQLKIDAESLEIIKFLRKNFPFTNFYMFVLKNLNNVGYSPEKISNKELSNLWYTNSSTFVTQFYGQLSFEKIKNNEALITNEELYGKNLLINPCIFFILSSISGGVGPLLKPPFPPSPPPPGGAPQGL